jgi:hypothetical protein
MGPKDKPTHDQRQGEHRRIGDLEAVLGDLAAAIGPGGDALARRTPAPEKPVLLLTGTARSGSTVMMWWLARSGAFAVPSNLMSRFWRAPVVGALVERLLFDPALDFRGELTLPAVGEMTAPYHSDIGKTRGPTSPHEFWYFWRHFLGFGNPPTLGESGRRAADVSGFAAHLGALEAARGQPVAMKALIASWELPFVAEALPTAHFLDLSRDPLQTMRSLLKTRERFYGDRTRWYSFLLPEMAGISELSPEEQVAVQVRMTRLAIDTGLASIDPVRVLRLDYDRLCADPQATWTSLRDWMGTRGLDLPVDHPDDPPPLRPAPPVESARLRDAWEASAAWLEATP